jgi:tetratricopeptide (TPR) repeat protein
VFARYTYLSPAKPLPGDHKSAERFFGEGIKAQQAGKPAQALASYQKAIQTDPAYFEAYYNQGLAAYGLGNWKDSLLDYEYALALKPNSTDARYNFALALQQSNYPLDAADELLEILNENPSDIRSHLLLANLYARQLNQPRLARQHYLKVLETDPRHPKAPEIRYWLAANP